MQEKCGNGRLQAGWDSLALSQPQCLPLHASAYAGPICPLFHTPYPHTCRLLCHRATRMWMRFWNSTQTLDIEYTNTFSHFPHFQAALLRGHVETVLEQHRREGEASMEGILQQVGCLRVVSLLVVGW